jgi:flagellar motor switch protein FliM
MAGTQTTSDTLRRKIAAARRGEGEAAPESAPRAFRLALARAARDEAGLDIDVRCVSDRRLSLAELLEIPPERAFLAMLEGPEGALGVMALSPALLTALIEMQTVGRLTTANPVPRRPTRTDAAMVAGTVERSLRDLEASLAEAPDLVWAGGFRYASFLEDARPLGLLLDDAAYRVLGAEVTLDGGARTAQVMLAVPAAGRGSKPAVRVPPERDAAQAARAWAQGMQAALNGATVSLDAVMTRLRLPLEQLMALAPGALLPIGTASLDSVAIEAPGGRRVAEARLGQNRGMRALRLTRVEESAATRPAAPPPAAGAEAARSQPTGLARSA